MKRLIIALIMFFGFTVPIDKDDAVIVDLQNQIEMAQNQIEVLEGEIMANYLVTEAEKLMIIRIWSGSETITTGNTFNFYSGLSIKDLNGCKLLFVTDSGNVVKTMVGDTVILADYISMEFTGSTAIFTNESGGSTTILAIWVYLT